jgi:TRAP transporter TAXI family solute receptor
MKQRLIPGRVLAALIGLAAFSALVLAALLGAGSRGAASTVQIPFNQQRISFQIATGSTAGTFFPVGEAIAGLISHPRGVDRCESANVCGPPGLIVTARTSDGAVDNLMAVNRGDVESGLAQSDVIAAAVKGTGPFRKLGPQDHVRVIASLFAEDVHLVVAAKSKIKSVADLRGKHVSLGSDGSGVGITAREILSAYRIPETAMKARQDDVFNSATLLKAGKLDAFFAVGGVPLDTVTDLIAHGQARLVPIDGPGRDRLLKAVPSFSAAAIPAGSYPGIGPVETVSARALWVVRDSEPDALVFGITQALFNPRNHDALASSHPSAREIGLATASLSPPAPLHPGAARFYASHH